MGREIFVPPAVRTVLRSDSTHDLFCDQATRRGFSAHALRHIAL